MFKLGMVNNEPIQKSASPSNPSTSPVPNNNPTPNANGGVQPNQPNTNTMAGSPINGSSNISLLQANNLMLLAYCLVVIIILIVLLIAMFVNQKVHHQIEMLI